MSTHAIAGYAGHPEYNARIEAGFRGAYNPTLRPGATGSDRASKRRASETARRADLKVVAKAAASPSVDSTTTPAQAAFTASSSLSLSSGVADGVFVRPTPVGPISTPGAAPPFLAAMTSAAERKARLEKTRLRPWAAPGYGGHIPFRPDASLSSTWHPTLHNSAVATIDADTDADAGADGNSNDNTVAAALHHRRLEPQPTAPGTKGKRLYPRGAASALEAAAAAGDDGAASARPPSRVANGYAGFVPGRNSRIGLGTSRAGLINRTAEVHTRAAALASVHR
ncbi:uncharacterized protein AMSG_05466 [Thecamonas trahens ATCC 50062]|uniref:Uncharacterized protein n=1 Tax=Thecamonas trahens ATCC 50062 TaxID=461836 RepID=A0A0L0DAU2_THETB|nr:hypothetical protein AMSG_05466 [Thecamonas trahens ATCC 50062]KNC49457.1 hypothetical protein AMSG_05466 [Thecamonas trahens ATCC 50062]|eukprot:XP_013757877.1 hypothetical protein AMSG_05466 [Thecamonas trahens ATCC 50062]